MPGTHPKLEKKYKKHPQEQIQKAVQDVKDGASIRKASKENGLLITTLARFIKQEKKKIKNKLGKDTVLTVNEENALAEWVRESGECGFGMISFKRGNYKR